MLSFALVDAAFNESSIGCARVLGLCRSQKKVVGGGARNRRHTRERNTGREKIQIKREGKHKKTTEMMET